jgi:Domain of unknown function (DUF1707)/Cell wall-active antibiotics response 4TMS YvqF
VSEDRPALRVSDADRERVSAALREHTVAGRLTLDEFSERIERAYAARTEDELEALTTDLPALSQPPERRRKPKRFLAVVFGGSERAGRWRIGRQFFSFTMFGGADLDLRQAEIDGPEVTITAFTMWGGVDVYVPEGVDVDLTGFALFGGNDEHGSEGEVRRDAPLVRVRMITIFGGGDVWHVPREAARVPFKQLPHALKRKALPPGSER